MTAATWWNVAEHSIQHKLGVVRTLFDRCYNIVTEPEDKDIEIQHITKALKVCGYPKWSFERVNRQIQQKGATSGKRQERKDPNEKSRGMVVLPYIKGTTEQLRRVYRKYQIATSVKPHHISLRYLSCPLDEQAYSSVFGVVSQGWQFDISCTPSVVVLLLL